MRYRLPIFALDRRMYALCPALWEYDESVQCLYMFAKFVDCTYGTVYQVFLVVMVRGFSHASSVHRRCTPSSCLPLGTPGDRETAAGSTGRCKQRGDEDGSVLRVHEREGHNGLVYDGVIRVRLQFLSSSFLLCAFRTLALSKHS